MIFLLTLSILLMVYCPHFRIRHLGLILGVTFIIIINTKLPVAKYIVCPLIIIMLSLFADLHTLLSIIITLLAYHHYTVVNYVREDPIIPKLICQVKY